MKVQDHGTINNFNKEGCKLNQMLFLYEHKEGVQHTYIHMDEI
jgi:hypothetical protein